MSGKSTLFNRLAGRKLAIVNDQPGVTRDRRTAPGRLGDLDLELIDTAGFEDVDRREPGGAHAPRPSRPSRTPTCACSCSTPARA